MNELLNTKDQEIQKLSEQVIELQLGRGGGKAGRPQSSNVSKGGRVMFPAASSPLSKKGKDYIPAGYSGITMVEEKLRVSEQHNAALQEEIRCLKKVQE